MPNMHVCISWRRIRLKKKKHISFLGHILFLYLCMICAWQSLACIYVCVVRPGRFISIALYELYIIIACA